MRSGLFALPVIFAMGTTAHAQQILSAGSIYGGLDQAVAVCYFYNSGDSSLSLSGTQLADQNGTPLTLTVNQCGATLPAGGACGIAANIANNTVYSCKTTVSPTKENARGILEVRDSSQETLQNIELR
jgi:hypothetical protein